MLLLCFFRGGKNTWSIRNARSINKTESPLKGREKRKWYRKEKKMEGCSVMVRRDVRRWCRTKKKDTSSPFCFFFSFDLFVVSLNERKRGINGMISILVGRIFFLFQRKNPLEDIIFSFFIWEIDGERETFWILLIGCFLNLIKTSLPS